MDTLADKVRARAAELGFSQVGIMPIGKPSTAPQLEQWLAEGRHGEMAYLEKHHDIRIGEAQLEAESRTVVVVWANYHQPIAVTQHGWRLARYALGEDYHEVLRERLRALGAFIHAETGAPVGTRPAVDTAPILERDLARSAGLGWIGKNSMLIDPDLGSYGFIAELYVDCEIPDAAPEARPDRCGSCTACIDACPTGAIVSPYVVDARRCISYLTIEARGPIPRELRPLIGDRLFGCDICQEVCPWNSKAPATTDDAFGQRESYGLFELTDLIRFPHSWYVEVFRGSAIKRAKYRGLLRNAAVVLGNRADPGDVRYLAEALSDNDEPLVRGHVAWALGQIDRDEAIGALRVAASTELDDYVLEEIRNALAADRRSR